MDGVITKQSEEYIMMMRILKKCSKEVLEFQDLPVPIANEVYMTGEQVCGVLHISSRTLQKLRDEKGIAYTVIGGKFLYPLSKIAIVIGRKLLKFPTLINRWKNNSLSNFLCKLVIDKQLISKAKQQNCYGSKNRENI